MKKQSKLREFVNEVDVKLPRAKKVVSIKKDLVEAARDCVAGVIKARTAGGKNGSKGKIGRPIMVHTETAKKDRKRARRYYEKKKKASVK